MHFPYLFFSFHFVVLFGHSVTAFGRFLLSGHFLDLDIADIIGPDICDHRPPLRLAIRLIKAADLLTLLSSIFPYSAPV